LNFARRLFNRDVQLAALDKDIVAATDITDPGERLIRYDDLAHRATDMRRRLGPQRKHNPLASSNLAFGKHVIPERL
jgi:hypothetical protein